MLSWQPAIGHENVSVLPFTVVARGPAGMQLASENSHSAPLRKLLLGHVVPASVETFWHTPVAGLHGPSPVDPGPSKPPTQLWNTLGSLKDWPSANVWLTGFWLGSAEHRPKGPG